MTFIIIFLTCSLLIAPVLSAVTGTKECEKMMTDASKCTMQLLLMNEDGHFSFPKDDKEADAFCEKADASLKGLTAWESCLNSTQKEPASAHIIQPLREMVNKVCKIMDRKLMHHKLSCFNKSVQEFDNVTATLVSELDQVQGLDSSERKNAVCCVMETLENKITNVSNDCSLEDWDYLEMIWHPLMLDLPDSICEGTGSGEDMESATSSNEHCKGIKVVTKTGPANGAKMDILAFLMQLISQ